MGILAEDVARVREATDIVGLISNTVALRKSGRRWQGLCPFHSEKTPSFSVNAEEGLYYCFGCRASGDAITFVRQTEGLDFAAGVEMLAARAGITLRYDSKGEAAQSGRRKKLIEAVAAAVEWYHERLLQHADAGAARGYLRSRGMSGDEVRAFKLGWAPEGWDKLSRALRSKVSAEVLIDAGLARQNERGRLTDHFHSRVLFPIFDVRGDPVGFGGRILPDDDGPAGPKYKNTPDSTLYVKSRLLYGLNWAKDAIVRAGEVIVCEGYTDVIGLHAAGLPRAVATCGTALTEDHVKTLSRFTKRILLAFDADAAGSAAAASIYRWESSYGLDVFVAELPEGADPDDLARRAPEVLRQKLDEPRQFLDYRIDRALEGVEGATAQGRVRFADAALAALDEHPSELVRDRYLVPVADRCKLDPDLLRSTVERFRAARQAARGGRAARSDGFAGIETDESAGPSIAEQVLLLRLHAPPDLPDWVTARLFESDVERRIFVALAGGASLRDLQDVAGDEVAPTVARLAVCEPPEKADAVIGRFVYNAAMRRIADLVREARRSGDAELGRRWAETQLARDELLASGWSLAVAERLVGLLDDLADDLAGATEPFGEPVRADGAPGEEERFYEESPDSEFEGPPVTDVAGAGDPRP
ncbi:MAG: DNA primase [bacterium]|nr:DNA primase [bacterium]